MRVVPAHSALFEKRHAFFSTESSKNTSYLGGVASNALDLVKCEVKIHKRALLLDFPAPFWLYLTHTLIFQNKPCFGRCCINVLFIESKNQFFKVMSQASYIIMYQVHICCFQICPFLVGCNTEGLKSNSHLQKNLFYLLQ